MSEIDEALLTFCDAVAHAHKAYQKAMLKAIRDLKKVYKKKEA